jgi:hypothetical protein
MGDRMKITIAIAALALWTGCCGAAAAQEPAAAAAEPKKPEPPAVAEFISPADSLPYLRYLADGLVTLNDRCPIRKVRLNPRMNAAYVNGRPVGFC